jgi:hypothetical protein
MSEIGVPRAGGKDQEIITDFRIGRVFFFLKEKQPFEHSKV